MDGKGEKRDEVDAAIQTTDICENTRKHSPTISPFSRKQFNLTFASINVNILAIGWINYATKMLKAW